MASCNGASTNTANKSSTARARDHNRTSISKRKRFNTGDSDDPLDDSASSRRRTAQGYHAPRPSSKTRINEHFATSRTLADSSTRSQHKAIFQVSQKSPNSSVEPETSQTVYRGWSPLQNQDKSPCTTSSEKNVEATESCTALSETVDDEAIVCYGQLWKLADLYIDFQVSESQELVWNGLSRLQHGHDRFITLSDKIVRILTLLSSSVDAFFDFRVEDLEEGVCNKTPHTKIYPAGFCAITLSVVIYGPKYASKDVGLWLTSADLYLQTPSKCSKDVPYCNPHLMHDPMALALTTAQIDSASLALRNTDVDFGHISELYTTRVFTEAPPPRLVRTSLHQHQRQALTFMQHRELGWDLYNERDTNDVWQQSVDAFGRETFQELLSGHKTFKPPVAFQGGILADEMGLGKTCAMLSLIASDEDNLSCFNRARGRKRDVSFKPTLIIVPLALLQVWERQIRQHLFADRLQTTTYYLSKNNTYHNLRYHDVVLTTYDMVAREWRNVSVSQMDGSHTPLLSTHWHRIVLDEAHVIKNPDTEVARAVGELDGDRRWCISGTPIQNRVSELYGLLKFLRLYPYDDFQRFEELFIKPWTVGADMKALHGLQALLMTVGIRRPRATVVLPPKASVTHHVKLSFQERQLYDQGRQGVARDLEASCSSSNLNVATTYLNALRKISTLRYVCNHGTLPPQMTSGTKISLAEHSVDSIREELDALLAVTDYNACTFCGGDLLEDPESIGRLQKCNGCPASAEVKDEYQIFDAGFSLFPITSSPKPRSTSELHISSKVRAVVREVQRTSSQDKCAIFSYWTSSLNLVSRALEDAGIAAVRYDGSMSRNKRDSVLNDFVKNVNIKVILVSITCGGQGLDLTAANHAFLLEPQWNPMLEEQAMSRVHRLGQKKPVYLVRFIVKDTWEEKIVALQERKRLLADLIVDRRCMESGDDGRKQLMWLRDLVG